jgi:hypothetical protein
MIKATAVTKNLGDIHSRANQVIKPKSWQAFELLAKLSHVQNCAHQMSSSVTYANIDI